jgi:two-component system chemotaxis response regulator CheY
MELRMVEARADMEGTLRLQPVLDLAAAEGFMATILQAVQTDKVLRLDASGVEALTVPCMQIIMSAGRTYGVTVANPSEVFKNAFRDVALDWPRDASECLENAAAEPVPMAMPDPMAVSVPMAMPTVDFAEPAPEPELETMPEPMVASMPEPLPEPAAIVMPEAMPDPVPAVMAEPAAMEMPEADERDWAQAPAPALVPEEVPVAPAFAQVPVEDEVQKMVEVRATMPAEPHPECEPERAGPAVAQPVAAPAQDAFQHQDPTQREETVMAKRIMTIDDSRTIRDMLMLTLTDAGYEVLQGVDGQDGIQVLGDQPVDVIITDINMPKMDGYGVIRHLRASPVHKVTPILVLTTESDKDKKMLARDAGATGWMVKPFDPDNLLATIRKVCP